MSQCKSLDDANLTIDSLRSEVSVLQDKMAGKCAAGAILSRELDQCRQDCDQFRAMLEQLRGNNRFQGGGGGGGGSVDWTWATSAGALQHQLAAARSRSQQLELVVQDLNQKMDEMAQDMKLLRSAGRNRHCTVTTAAAAAAVGACRSQTTQLPTPPPSSSAAAAAAAAAAAGSPVAAGATVTDTAELLNQLELWQSQCRDSRRELDALACEKDELVCERHALRLKVHRLNYQLCRALQQPGTSSSSSNNNNSSSNNNSNNSGSHNNNSSGSSSNNNNSSSNNNSGSSISDNDQLSAAAIDIDALVCENRHLKPMLRLAEEEVKRLSHANAKYKKALECESKRGSLILKSASAIAPSLVATKKQVSELLCSRSPAGRLAGSCADSPAELRSLCAAVLDQLEDKCTALSHQRRTCRLLAEYNGHLRTMLEKHGLCVEPASLLMKDYKEPDADDWVLEDGTADATSAAADLSYENSRHHLQSVCPGSATAPLADSNHSGQLVTSTERHCDDSPADCCRLFDDDQQPMSPTDEVVDVSGGESCDNLSDDASPSAAHKANASLVDNVDVCCSDSAEPCACVDHRYVVPNTLTLDLSASDSSSSVGLSTPDVCTPTAAAAAEAAADQLTSHSPARPPADISHVITVEPGDPDVAAVATNDLCLVTEHQIVAADE